MPVEFRHYPSIGERGKKIELTIATGPVIIEEGKVLLNMHGDPYWKFPGGGYIEDLNFENSARREVLEELGIDITIKSKPFIMVIKRMHKGVLEYVLLVHYLAERLGEIKPAKDIEKYKWFPMNKLPKNCAPNIRPVVKHFKKRLSK